jgi:uncharacterized Zn finger protein (UPF0148 family)
MAKSRTCPHCREIIPAAVTFNARGSLICPLCEKVVIPAVSQDDYPKHTAASRFSSGGYGLYGGYGACVQDSDD